MHLIVGSQNTIRMTLQNQKQQRCRLRRKRRLLRLWCCHRKRKGRTKLALRVCPRRLLPLPLTLSAPCWSPLRIRQPPPLLSSISGRVERHPDVSVWCCSSTVFGSRPARSGCQRFATSKATVGFRFGRPSEPLLAISVHLASPANVNGPEAWRIRTVSYATFPDGAWETSTAKCRPTIAQYPAITAEEEDALNFGKNFSVFYSYISLLSSKFVVRVVSFIVVATWFLSIYVTRRENSHVL